MDSLKFKVVFDRRKSIQTPKDKGDIEIYVYDSVCRKTRYINTGISVSKNQLEKPLNQEVRIVKHPNANVLNGLLSRIYREVEAYGISDQCKKIEDIINWNIKPENTVSVVSFMKAELIRKNLSIRVAAHHQTLIKRIEQFNKIKVFSDFTYDNIVDFDSFLKTTGSDRESLSDVTAYKRHSMLNSYIKEAINRGLCKYNPYGSFKPKKGKSKDPVYLTEFELEAIMKCKIENVAEGGRLAKVKDVFVFQCLTGMAYIDLVSFTRADIFELDNFKVIRSHRQKTDEGFIIVLTPDALEILEKYDYKLPTLSNQKYNDYLKILSLYVVDEKTKKPLIKKKLTSHVARHTCGTYLLNKGVPIETVARTLGHSDTKMTRHYAKLLGHQVVHDIASYVINK